MSRMLNFIFWHLRGINVIAVKYNKGKQKYILKL